MQEHFENSLNWAQHTDQKDPLHSCREQFHFPVIDGKEALYFTGNSLGLQPKSTKSYIDQELEDWAKWGVEGHFHAKNPWYSYHEILTPALSKIVGAQENEVVVTHSLSTNLHLLLVSFYRPTEKRYKILCEKKAFPSDQYILETQVKYHGYTPEEAIIEVVPREGEHTIRHEDIIKTIEEHGDEIATIMWGGVNYYTGQLFDMKSITEAAHKKDIIVGFDLAHGVGNAPLQLHDWGVDFAAWCSYKYLNSSPGGASGMYIHESHAQNTDLPRFGGWWGHDKENRFLMEPGFQPIPTAEGWQLSNAPVLSMAAHKASLDLFDEVGMKALRDKSEKLTAYLEYIIHDISERNQEKCQFEIITPAQKAERGCQLSILAHGQGRAMFDALTKEGVIADWREPNVIRVAPAPMYNSFEDVYRFGEALERSIV